MPLGVAPGRSANRLARILRGVAYLLEVQASDACVQRSAVRIRRGLDELLGGPQRGLWIHVEALLAKDVSRLVTTLQQGLATPEHAAFVGRLEDARKAREQGSP